MGQFSVGDKSHSLEPVGFTSSYRSFSSESFAGLIPGLAFLISVSVSGIGKRPKPVIFQDTPSAISPYPQTYPRIVVDCNKPFRTLKNKKAPIYGANSIFTVTLLNAIGR